MTHQPIVLPSPVAADAPQYRYWGRQKPDEAMTRLALASPRLSVDSTKATLRMYGPIDDWGGIWGVSAKEVAAALDSLDDTVTEIQLRVNCPGGSCWEGLTILNLLRAHPAKVTAVVDGIAASAASFVVTSCDERVMSPGTQMMIHCSSAIAYGTAETMRKAATINDKIDTSMAELYASAGAGKVADWLAQMQEETWYTASEAVGAGLADRVAVVPDVGQAVTAGAEDPDEVTPAPDPEAVFDLSMYRHPGRSKAPAPAAVLTATHNPPSASAVGSPPTQEGSPAVAFSDEQVTNMRQKLGIAEDADETTILAALDEALDERLEPAATATTPEVPEGHVVVPKAQIGDLEQRLATLTRQAEAGAAAAEELRVQKRDAFLDANRGKFAPVNRDAWAKEFDRDPEGTRKHFEEAPEIIPTAEVGHEVAPEATAEDDGWFPGYTTTIVKES
jgi:ATP-dependent protease ClpP protease subunit